MIFSTPLLLLTMSLCVFGCTTMVHPYPLNNDVSDDPVKVVTVPLPAISANPNEGLSSGVLVAFLIHNKKDEVSTLLAPQVNYNRYYGVSTSLYGAFYPSPTRSWEFNISKSTRVNEDYEFSYVDRSLFGGKVEGRSHFYVFTDGSARFFGFGPKSLLADQTNFGDRESGVTLSLAYGIAEHLHLVMDDRFRRVDIAQGAVRSVPFILDKFSGAEVPGIDGFSVHAQKLGLVYSTLDFPDLPTAGLYAATSVEESARDFGSSVGFIHYQAEVKGYAPSESARWISVYRVAYNQTPGGDVPFLEQNVLGGETTLRGYGRNRFIDNTSLLLNLEERIKVIRWTVFNVRTDWELAPFVDIGGVMGSLGSVRRDDFKINPGVGFRAVVRPNIVGRVDIGFSNEGVAVFVGLGYPF